MHEDAAPRLTAAILLRLYAGGVFPMAEARDVPDLFIVDPPRRAIFELSPAPAPSKRLARTVRSDLYEVRVDTAFEAVVSACAGGGEERPETWINAQIEALYTELHHSGFAHSVECWREGELVGGLYGVSIGGAFFGESMFSRARDASKVALVHLLARLVTGGFTLLDCQFMTDHLASLGAVEISRRDYRKRLAKALDRAGNFYDLPAACDGASALQAITHKS